MTILKFTLTRCIYFYKTPPVHLLITDKSYYMIFLLYICFCSNRKRGAHSRERKDVRQKKAKKVASWNHICDVKNPNWKSLSPSEATCHIPHVRSSICIHPAQDQIPLHVDNNALCCHSSSMHTNKVWNLSNRWFSLKSPYLCFDSPQFCSQRLQVQLQALNLEISAGQKTQRHSVLTQIA